MSGSSTFMPGPPIAYGTCVYCPCFLRVPNTKVCNQCISTGRFSVPIQCANRDCTRLPWNGKLGEYCSRKCRDNAAPSHPLPLPHVASCALPGCGKPSYNGQPGQYCSKGCRNRATVSHPMPLPHVASCALSGCGKPSYNGQPGQYCSKTCQRLGK